MGSRRKDIEESVFFVTKKPEEAFDILKQRTKKEAELLAKIRGYDLEPIRKGRQNKSIPMTKLNEVYPIRIGS